LVVPGNYVVELSAAGKTLRQPLTVTLDPRLHVSAADLQAQLDLMQQISRGLAASYEAFHRVADLRAALADRKKLLGENLKEDVAALEKKIDAIDKGTRTAPGFGPANRDLTRMASSAQGADVRPADTVRVVVEDRCKSLDADLGLWRNLNAQDLAGFNAKLQTLKLMPLPIVDVPVTSSCAP